MADPKWQFMGSVGSDGYAWFQDDSPEDDGNYYRGGYQDIVVHLWNLKEYNNNNDDNFYLAQVPMAHMDPGWDGDVNGKPCDWGDRNKQAGPVNHRAELSLDWNWDNAYTSSDLQDYKPSSSQEGDYSYSGSISAVPTNGSVGVNYEPEKIRREYPDRTGDEVVWNWKFIHTTWHPTDEEARFNDTNLSAGSSCKLTEPMDDPDDNDLIRVSFNSKWERTDNGVNHYFSRGMANYIEERDL